MKVTKIIALLVLLLSFGGNCVAAEYVSLEMYPKQIGVFTSVGKQQFIVFGKKADGTLENITRRADWHSSNENLVTINETGLAAIVGSVTSGHVQISCTYPKKPVLSGVNLLLLRTTYTLHYTAGAHGSIKGPFLQEVAPTKNGTRVDAVPDPTYHFDRWSDDKTNAARTDTNVRRDISVTAFFTIDTYTLRYTAGANGSLTGTSPQTVAHGSNGSIITAVAVPNYHFVDWSDGQTTNPRTDTNVTANITVTANFAIDTYTLEYIAGENGTITGVSPQEVDHGADGSLIEAVPDGGFHFVEWSDDANSLPYGYSNPRTDTGVTGPISATASFAAGDYTLSYSNANCESVGGAGHLETHTQEVAHGGSGSPVDVTPGLGKIFDGWSDWSTADPRTDSDIKKNVTVTAHCKDTPPL